MPTQRVTIASITGPSADALRAQHARWVRARPSERTGRLATVATRPIDRFIHALRVHPTDDAVAFYAELVDRWSVGAEIEMVFAQGDVSRTPRIATDRFELWCYFLPDGDALATSLRKALRTRRSYRREGSQERRWLTQNILAAVSAWQPLVARAAIVVIRECLGPALSDEQFLAAQRRVAQWIRRG